jgi:TP901 family phage tail tape measure protein
MATATVGILRVLLTANTAEFESAMKRASGAAQVWTKELNQVGRQATQIGSALTKTLTLPIVVAMGGAVKAAMDFESSFANVGKTVDGVSDKFGKLTPKGLALANAFRQMAKEIPATTDELNAIASMGGQMGVPIERLATFTKHVAALGVAVDGIGAEEAAKGLAQIANVFGDKEVKDIDKMSSALVHLGNSSNATEADILEFSKRLAGAGNSVGMTIPEVMALGTAMANVGINAEAGGTAMSTVIGKISKAVSSGGESLKEFAKVANLSAEEFTATWKRSPIEAIDLFVRGLSTMKTRGVDLNLTMGELGTEGIRVADTLKRLAGAGTGVGDSLKIANEGFGTTNKHLEEAEKKYATTSNQLKILWNNVRDVGITFGNALLPAIQSSISVLQSIIPVVDMLAKGFAAMPGPLQMLVVGMGLAVAAVGPLIYIFGQLVLASAAVTGAFTKKGIATKLLAADHAVLTGAAGRTATALTLLGKAAAGAAAFFVGWQIGRLIADLTGLDQKIADSINKMELLQKFRAKAAQGDLGARAAELTKLQKEYNAALDEGDDLNAKFIKERIDALKNDQTYLAIQDVITKAIKAGAAANITYADAIAFNNKKHEEQVERLKAVGQEQHRAGGATKALTDKMDELAAKLQQADKDISGLSATARNKLAAALKSGAFEMKELEAASGLSEFAIKRFEDRLKTTEKVFKSSELGEYRKKLTDLVEGLTLAERNQSSITDIADKFGKQIAEVTQEARVYGQVVPDVVKRNFDAVTKFNVGKVLKEQWRDLNEELAKQARAKLDQGLDEWFRIEETKLDLRRATESELRKITGTSLKETLADIQREAHNRRIQFDERKSEHREVLEQITAWELQASAAAADAWAKVADVPEERKRPSFAGAFLDTLKSAPALIQQALTGGGGISGGLKALGSRLGSDLFGALFAKGSKLNDFLATQLGKGLSALTGKSITAISAGLAKAIPFIGEAIGALIGPLMGKLLKTESKHINDVRDEFLKGFGPGGFSDNSGFNVLAKQLAALGKEGEQAFQKLIRASSQKEWDAALKNVNALLSQQREEFTRLAAAGGVASKQLIAFRDATRDTAETIAFIKSETQTAATSFNAYLKAGADAYTKLADLRKQYNDAAESDRGRIADEIKQQEKLIAAIAVTPTGSLASVRKAMSPAELESLSKAYTEALREGFKGTQDEFLRQQLDFYNTLDEGDERLKTWFSGTTIDAFNAGAKARLDAAKAAMDPAELEALTTAYQKALVQGFTGSQDDFLRQQLDFYSTLQEGDERLKTWFSDSTLKAYLDMGVATSAGGAIGAALAGTFGALMEQGMSAREALKVIEPGIASLKIQLEATGQSGGEAFDYIARLAGIAAGQISGPALDAISHLTRGLEGAHNAGFLTQEMFGGLIDQIMASRQAIIEQGASAEDTNRLMQGDLQTIWQLQKDFGYEVDDATQLLLDEAEAAGVVGDKYRSAMDRAAIAMEKVALALEKIINNGKSLGSVLDDATKPRTVRIGFDVDNDGIPGQEGFVPDVAATGGRVTRTGIQSAIQYRGLGGPINWTRRGTDTVPAMLTPGELILNEGQQGNIGAALDMAMRAMQPGAMLPPLSSSGPMRSTTILEVDKRELGRAVADVLPGELRRLGVRVRA